MESEAWIQGQRNSKKSVQDQRGVMSKSEIAKAARTDVMDVSASVSAHGQLAAGGEARRPTFRLSKVAGSDIGIFHRATWDAARTCTTIWDKKPAPRLGAACLRLLGTAAALHGQRYA